MDTPDEIYFFASFLKAVLKNRQQSNPSYSLRMFAREIQIDPATLSRVLNSKEELSFKSASKIIKQLSIESIEKEHFINSVVEAHKRRWAL